MPPVHQLQKRIGQRLCLCLDATISPTVFMSSLKGALHMAMDFGIVVPQGWRMDLVGIADPVEAYETMTRVAQEAEALGFHSIWLYDHFHTVPVPSQEVTFECWTSIAALARDTKRVREAVQIILAMWTQEEASFEGTYYQVKGAINQPKGVQKPHIPLLIGGGGEKVTLRLVAQYADACNVGGDIANIKHKFTVLKRHCEELGRDYNSIRRTILIDDCAIAETEEEAIAKLTPAQRNNLEELRQTQLIGTPSTIRQRLAEYE